jgi:hypothetical protein
MKPDRSNYEIWLIDWLDGNLDKAQVEQLLSFLDENPDLKEEADSLSHSHLSPIYDHFSNKNISEKAPSDLPSSQVEYLSVAYLENDLSADQYAELQENFAENPENKKLFESVQKIRLVPQQHFYKNKNGLKKLTPAGKVIKFSAIGLSAAATIAILILSYIFVPQYISEKKSPTAQIITQDTGSIQPFVLMTTIFKRLPEGKNEFKYTGNESADVISNKKHHEVIIDQSFLSAVSDTSLQETKTTVIAVATTPVISKPGVIIEPLFNYLIASNNEFHSPAADDERNRLSKFIARTFRERVLNEGSSGDEPLKAYELAEAGVEGLNKLLGWDMVLVATNDKDGELKSVYFSSSVLKFNAPVKKDAAVQ